jgi:hypothetical protein
VEGHAAGAAFAAFDVYLGFVEEFHMRCPYQQKTGDMVPPAFLLEIKMRLRRLFFGGNDGNILAVETAAMEFHDTVAQGEEGVVFADADEFARMYGSAALAHDDRAFGDGLAAVDFYAKAPTR